MLSIRGQFIYMSVFNYFVTRDLRSRDIDPTSCCRETGPQYDGGGIQSVPAQCQPSGRLLLVEKSR
jgi:hypothetical protein